LGTQTPQRREENHQGQITSEITLIETLNFWPSITLKKMKKKKEIQHNI